MQFSARRMSPRFSPGDLPTVEEDALKAERLWWSEASERQIKELGDSFGQQFRISSDRLEMLLDTEKRARTAGMAELRRDFEDRLADFERRAKVSPAGRDSVFLASACQPRSSVGLQLEGDVLALQKQVQEMRAELSSVEARSTGCGDTVRSHLEASRAAAESQRTQLQQQEVQVSALEAALSDLRRELATVQEGQALQTQDLRSWNASREKSHIDKQSADEVAALRKMITQSAGDLGRGIEEVSAGVLATEAKLRREAEERGRELEGLLAKKHQEALEAMARSREQLARSVRDEAEKRELEANVLRTHMTSLQSQVGEPRCEGSSPTAGSSPKVDSAASDLSRLERCAAEDCKTHSTSVVELKCSLEHLGKTVTDRLQSLEADLRSLVAQRFAAEQSARLAEVADVKSYAEGILMGAGKAVAEATANRTADTLSVTLPAVSASAQDQELMWREIRRLKASLEALASEERLLEMDMRKATATAVVTRVESLEERVGQQRVAVLCARMDGIEGEMRQAARVPELKRIKEEMKKMELDVMPLDSRMDHLESELRRANRDASVLLPRLDAIESQASRLARESASSCSSIAALRLDLEGVKARTTMASAEAAREKMPDRTAEKTVSDVSTAVPSYGLPSGSVLLDDTRMTTGSGIVSAPNAAWCEARDSQNKEALPPSDLKSAIGNIVQKVNKTLVNSNNNGVGRGDRSPSQRRESALLSDDLRLQDANVGLTPRCSRHVERDDELFAHTVQVPALPLQGLGSGSALCSSTPKDRLLPCEAISPRISDLGPSRTTSPGSRAAASRAGAASLLDSAGRRQSPLRGASALLASELRKGGGAPRAISPLARQELSSTAQGGATPRTESPTARAAASRGAAGGSRTASPTARRQAATVQFGVVAVPRTASSAVSPRGETSAPQALPRSSCMASPAQAGFASTAASAPRGAAPVTH